MKAIEELKKCPYFDEIREHDRGNKKSCYIYTFEKDNGITYIVEHDEEEYFSGLRWDIEANWRIKTWEEMDTWFKKLYLDVEKKENDKKRIRRLLANKKLEILDLIFYHTGLEEEGKEMYECYRKTKKLYTKNKQLAEMLKKAFETERYDAKIVGKENVYYLYVKDDENHEN
jgi:hypothetical protein